MARELSENDDVAPVQLERLHAASADVEHREDAMLDSLTRYLREALRRGWGVGTRWRGSLAAAFTSWNVTWGGGAELDQLERALLQLSPPSGWVPDPSGDLLLSNAARAAWESPRR
jgi:hypothetical protein